MTLLRNLLAQSQIWAIVGLVGGGAYLLFLIVYRSRIIQNRPGSKTAWILLIEMAIFNMMMGVLHWLSLYYGVSAWIAGGLAGWLLVSAMLATIVVLLINISRGPRRS